MNRVLSLLIYFLTVSLSARAEFNASQIEDADFDHCQKWSPKDWDQYKSYLLKEYPSDDLLRPEFEDFQKIYSKCKTKFTNFAPMVQCLERAEYLGKLLNRHNKPIHVSKTNEEYFNSQNEELLKLPPEFKNGVPSNFKEIANKNGWKCVTFKSKLKTAVDHGNAMYRTIFAIPRKVQGKTVMQRILATSLTPDPSKSLGTIQIISTEHDYDGRVQNGEDKGAKMHYRIFVSKDDTLQYFKKGNSCAECHMTGPIRIKPDAGFEPDLCGDYDLKALNEELLKDSTEPNQEEVLDPRLHPQPTIGNFPISADGKVGVDGPGSVRCIDCHNDVGGPRRPLQVGTYYLGPISQLPMWSEEVRIHQHMPPGKQLSVAEWEKAKKLLLKEQQDGIRAWLDAKKCDGTKIQNSNPEPQPGID